MAADPVVIFAPIAAALAAVSVGALIKVVRVFLKHIEEKDQQFTTFLGNHMSGNTKALENLTSATSILSDRLHNDLGRLTDGFQDHHDEAMRRQNERDVAPPPR